MADITIGIEFLNNSDSVKENIDEVKESIQELNEEVVKTGEVIKENNTKTGQSFEQVKGKYLKLGDDISKVGAGIAGAFAAANGVVGAFGKTLGYSEEEMKKAQETAASYLSIVASVKPLFEGGIAAIELGMAAYKSLSAGLKSAQTAQIGLNVAMTANPIGLIVVAIAAAVAAIAGIVYAIYSFREEIYEAIVAIGDMGTGLKVVIGILGGPFTLAILATIEVLKYLGVIESQVEMETRKATEARVVAAKKETEGKISEIRKQRAALEQSAVDEKATTDAKIKTLDWEMQKRQAAGLDVSKIEKEKIQTMITSAENQLRVSRSIIESLDKELYARREYMIEYKKQMGEDTKALEAELNIEKAARKRNLDEQLSDQTNTLTQLQQQLELFNIKQAAAAKNATKESIEESKVEWDEYLNWAETKFKDPFTLKVDVQPIEEEEDPEIEDEVFQSKLDKFLAFRKVNSEQSKAFMQDMADEWAAIAIAGIENYQKYSDGVASIIGSIQTIQDNSRKKDTEMSKQQAERRFKIEKLLAINSAAIAGAQAVVKSVAASPQTFGLPFSAFSIATTAVQIAAIASKKFDAGSTSAPSTPSVPNAGSISGNNNTQQFNFNTSGLSNLNNAPQPNLTVSVEEITTVQNRMATYRESGNL